MKSKHLFTLLGILLIGAIGFAGYMALADNTGKVVKSTAPRTSSPVTRLEKEKSGTAVRSAKSLQLSRKDNVGADVDEKDLQKASAPAAELDAKFATWRTEGKKAVEEMFGGDRQKIGDAFRNAMQNEDFRNNYAKMRELEGKYREASDDQKQGLMDDLAAIRSRGLGMLKQAAAQPATILGGNNTTSITINGDGTAGAAPSGGAAPAPAAPPAPFVYQ